MKKEEEDIKAFFNQEAVEYEEYFFMPIIDGEGNMISYQDYICKNRL